MRTLRLMRFHDEQVRMDKDVKVETADSKLILTGSQWIRKEEIEFRFQEKITDDMVSNFCSSIRSK